MARRPEDRKKTTVFITVDTEDDYFDCPHLITGDGVDPNFALPGILDRLESRGFRACFFLNVYGHVNFANGLLADIAREISDRGHDVELHAHQNTKLDFYRSKLFEYDLSGQKRILEYGQSLLQRWCGREAVAFRAGGFQFNADTLSAIKEVGCKLDSSYIFSSDRPKISTDWISEPREYNGILEVPITYTPIVLTDGTIKHAIFDLNSLRFDELSSVMNFAKRFQVRFLTFIMHSFSMIDKLRRDRRNPPMPGDKEPILRSQPDMYSGYVDIFGTKRDVAERFERFLNLLQDNPNFEVKTFRESLPELEKHVSSDPVERLPILYR
jgi:peptidoglycan/xylan/chitin deacetylase (PgdA/CDA1 family)